MRRGFINYKVLRDFFFFLVSISSKRKINHGLIKWRNKQDHPGSGTESAEARRSLVYHSCE